MNDDKGSIELRKFLFKIKQMTPSEFMEYYNSTKEKYPMRKVIEEQIDEYESKFYCSYCEKEIEKDIILEAQSNNLDFVKCPNCILTLSLIDICQKVDQ